MTKRIIIHIQGVVQGVGFRPTVYRYALERKLRGFVTNTGRGVTIELEGDENSLEDFQIKLKKNPPSASAINDFLVREIPVREDEEGFSIKFSEHLPEMKSAGISPDLATCPDCLEEIFAKDNRRFGYPFTNCTNCGPRFTIIRDRPYDRPLTTMASFEMCPDCRAEFKDPLNRRFHAQPNACPRCGPSLTLRDPDGNFHNDSGNLIELTAQLLQEGKIGALKGLGGFHFACDPLNNKALEELRIRKDRPHKAFALMMRDLDEAARYCQINPEEKEALLSPAAPIVLLRKKNDKLNSVSPDNNYLGVMLPFTPLHHLLLKSVPLLIMTSANRRDEPLAVEDDEVEKFASEGIIDFYLTHDRPIAHRCDDSIIQFVAGRRQLIRRSRGFVPNPIFVIDKSLETIRLSMGANMKNTFSFRRNREIFLSQHMGDLTDYRNLLYQKEQIEDFRQLLDMKIEEIKIDAHPSYENYNEEAHKVYHHHSHMLSVMAEHDLGEEPVLGIICDGTGYGTDDTIWGFEFLKSIPGDDSFVRLGHLDSFPLPGGESAIREIDRIAIALGEGLENLPFPDKRVNEIRNLIEADLNCPRTSSLGRLFDGITALLGLTDFAEYEARGAILLQKEAENLTADSDERYSTEIIFCCDTVAIDYKILIKEILRDLKKEKSRPLIAWKFHRWIADAIGSMLQHLERAPIVLSGGCFQNTLLTKMVMRMLEKREYTYFMNEEVPPNDGGISLGQGY